MDKQIADLESARDRATRFGKLPARIHPEEAVEAVDTAAPQPRPTGAATEELRQVFLAGG
ncbi:hypothetical protein BJ973_004337 [Actinoplanes tereljensis]|uniref:Uncharacterized protein n=1 Tax=Paractinoplanes tereljensis TaxID=571912 RepID=A0A919NTI0_9ACTN|nr:hypothetical protein [Actinoplanes tereljensis]GIF23726.1 hypothetical protein Ate02nite_64560 [Actinoplanes tereljensis]